MENSVTEQKKIMRDHMQRDQIRQELHFLRLELSDLIAIYPNDLERIRLQARKVCKKIHDIRLLFFPRNSEAPSAAPEFQDFTNLESIYSRFRDINLKNYGEDVGKAEEG